MRARALASMAAAVAPFTAAAGAPDQPLEWIDDHLPGVCCLEPAPRGFVATFCGLYAALTEPVPPAPPPPLEDGRNEAGLLEETPPLEEAPEPGRLFPRLRFDGRTGWQWLAPARSPLLSPCSPSEWPTGWGSVRRCPEKLRRAFPRLTADELHRLRPETSYAPDVEQQGPSACVDHGGFTWFGISFYDSEGVTGVGGIGRFEPRTGNVELRRPRLLLASSSTALAHDGRWLWLRTFRIGEGYSEPTHGLVRYDWARDELAQEIDGPCGFRMVGAVVLDGALWVAHDAGLSRRDAHGRWQHFVLPVGREPTAVPTGCDGVYAFARSKLPEDLRRMFDEEIRLWRSVVLRRAP